MISNSKYTIIPIGECVHSGFCWKQSPCAFGQWNEKKHQCEYLTKDNMCDIYDLIKTKPGWEINPAFGAGCSSTLFNEARDKILAERKKNV